MDMKDYRLNAYKNGARTDEKNKVIRKPVFEKIVTSKSFEPINDNITKLDNSHFDKDEKKLVNPSYEKVENLLKAKNTKQSEKSKSVKNSTDFLSAENELKEATRVLTNGGLIKVPVPEKDDGKESVYRRVAKFLMIIGVEEAAKILPHLTDEQTEKIIPEIASIRTISENEKTTILAEFQSIAQKVSEGGGVATAKTILEKAFGKKRAEEMMKKTVKINKEKPFEYLEDANPEKILLLLKDELPAICALVLSHLNPQKAAHVINLMENDLKKETILRLAKMQKISPDVIERIDHTMHEKANAIQNETLTNLDGRNALAQILKRMDSKTESDILSNLSNDNEDLAIDIKQRLFTLEDIVNADDKFMQQTLQKMDDSTIAILIAGKSLDFRNKILFNVSSNRANLIVEEENLKKPFLRSDCIKITNQFLSTMRNAYEDGKFIIKGRSDDVYV